MHTPLIDCCSVINRFTIYMYIQKAKKEIGYITRVVTLAVGMTMVCVHECHGDGNHSEYMYYHY